jgi:hypothetical protein
MDEVLHKLQTPKEICLLALLMMCLISLFIIWPSLKKKGALSLRIIQTYILLIIIQILIGYYEMFSAEQMPIGKNSIMNVSAYCFIICEFLIFTILLRIALNSILIKDLLLLSSLLFPLFSLLIWFRTGSIFSAFSQISTLESAIIIPSCLYYFYELLKIPPIINLSREPYFWIVTGILFLSICITPFYLAINFIKPTPEMQIVDHIAYILIVSLFTKAKLVFKEH